MGIKQREAEKSLIRERYGEGCIYRGSARKHEWGGLHSWGGKGEGGEGGGLIASLYQMEPGKWSGTGAASLASPSRRLAGSSSGGRCELAAPGLLGKGFWWKRLQGAGGCWGLRCSRSRAEWPKVVGFPLSAFCWLSMSHASVPTDKPTAPQAACLALSSPAWAQRTALCPLPSEMVPLRQAGSACSL